MSEASRGATVSVSKQQRQDELARLIYERGSIRTDELIELFDVSPMTLYRDLATLESKRLVRRSRGEVAAVTNSTSETPISFRLVQDVSAKAKIAKAAAEILADYSTIFLDDSTTALAIVDLLPDVQQKTYITNSLALSRALSQSVQGKLISLGGTYNPQLDAFFGPTATKEITNLNPSAVVVGAASVQNLAVYHPYAEVGSFKSLAMSQAEFSVLVVAAPKFKRTSLHKMAEISDFDCVITDDGIDEETLAELRGETHVIVAR